MHVCWLVSLGTGPRHLSLPEQGVPSSYNILLFLRKLHIIVHHLYNVHMDFTLILNLLDLSDSF